MTTRLDSWIFTNILWMIFTILHENSHYRNGYIQGNRENHMEDEFVKIGEFTPVIIFVIFP